MTSLHSYITYDSTNPTLHTSALVFIVPGPHDAKENHRDHAFINIGTSVIFVHFRALTNRSQMVKQLTGSVSMNKISPNARILVPTDVR